MTEPSPRVSVVLPTHNRAALLPGAVGSVLAQTFGNLEAVVVDDGSTDGTRAAIERIADPRLRYVCQANAGPCAARNRGIAEARGRYVAFLDDDDAWLPGKLEAQVRLMSERPELGLAGCGYTIVDERGRPLGEARPWRIHPDLDLATWLHGCPVIPSAALVRREWLEAAGGFDPGVRFLEDWDLFLRLAGAGCPMAWVEEVLCVYRISPQGRMTGRTDHAQWTLAVLERFYARPDVPPEALALRDAAHTRAHLRAAAWETYHGRPEAAARHVERAVALQPGLLEMDAEALGSGLAVLAAEAVIAEPEALCRALPGSLPGSIRVSGRWRRRVRAYGAFQGLFRAHARGERGRAARCLWALALNEPRRLWDHGVASAAAGALLGPRAAARLRAGYRRLAARKGHTNAGAAELGAKCSM